MKQISKFLLSAFILCGVDAYAAAPVATTVGSNLTAYNGNSGATNNAMWNSYMNPRANNAVSAPTADFGNCNALILRCAQPKCANGGCTSLEIARPIVSGCVESNSSCKQYGTGLIDYISAQLVATSTANATQAAADAQVAAAQAAAQQSAQQMAQMQQQMTQMQQQMQQQSADTAAQIQAALEQQQQATSLAIADATLAMSSMASDSSAPNSNANAATTTSATGTVAGIDLTVAQQVAAESGVSADLLAREQISGEILTKIENAEVALKSAKAAMEAAFEYAGCDSTGSNCTGPKRVATFKNKAMEFFDPYNDVLKEVYNALILAQSIGVDISDIYMLLSGSCNAWGFYLCEEGKVLTYDRNNCSADGISMPVESNGGIVYGNAPCKVGQIVPMSDGGCQLIQILSDKDVVRRNFLNQEEGVGGVQVRVGCASQILDMSPLFKNIDNQTSIDIEVLKRIIEQDAPSTYGTGVFGGRSTPEQDGLPYCTLNDSTYRDLQKIASLKMLPEKVCVTETEMRRIAKNGVSIAQTSGESTAAYFAKCSTVSGIDRAKCLCNAKTGGWQYWENNKCVCFFPDQTFDYNRLECVSSNENTASDVSQINYTPLDSYDPLGGQALIDSLTQKIDSGLNQTKFTACVDYGGSWDPVDKTCNCATEKNMNDINSFQNCLTLVQ